MVPSSSQYPRNTILKIHFQLGSERRISYQILKNTSAGSPYTAESGVQKAREILEMQKWHKNIPTEY